MPSKLLSLEVENFQSIKHARVDFGGLTAIVGKNRSGKTAMLRAFHAACLNDTGTAFIRHGEKQCRVTISTEAGELVWTKQRTGGASYVLTDIGGNVRTFTKLGAGVPEEVQQFLGIVEFEIDKTLTLTPQLHDDRNVNFLLDKSEGQTARALARMTRLDIVVSAQQLIRNDLRAAKSDLRSATALIANLEGQLEDFATLPERERAQAKAERLYDDVEAHSELLAREQAAYDAYRAAKKELRRLRDIPEDVDFGELQGDVESIYYQQKFLEDYTRADAVLSRLGETPSAQAINGAYDRAVTLAQARSALGEYVFSDDAFQLALHELTEHGKQNIADIREWNALDLCSVCGQPLPKIKIPAPVKVALG